MSNILEIHNVSKSFTKHQALTDVSFDVPKGCIYGLLGPNGAGKTTLIRIINHITAPDSGHVVFNGHTLVASDVYSIGYLPEERGLYKKMKVGDQAMFFARLKGLGKAQARKSLEEWFERLDITSWWNKKVEELSKGMAQKVQFIVTVLHNPDLLIFDEPFSGFDPINAAVLKREILRLRDNGATVIFSTHNMSSVEELCDEITLINKSKNILTGSVADVRSSYGANRYRISTMSTEPSVVGSLTDAISPFVIKSEVKASDKLTAATVEFTLKDADALRPLIAAANEAVTLRSFEPYMPSMDEIFISAVENSNTPQPPVFNQQ
ncbi:MAG: ATP-binding cassette domain-containing protein [Muribaculaceae bacterium]|nr:ATP-binding cassette domain-containing protein [Muribaculaceae bacterium]